MASDGVTQPYQARRIPNQALSQRQLPSSVGPAGYLAVTLGSCPKD